MNRELKVGFVGFGEAGYHLAKGLRRAGLGYISAYDINIHTPTLGERIQHRAAESEVVMVESNADLVSSCEVVLSTVTANQAQEAAKQTAPYLDASHLYADLNSVSPVLKHTIKSIVETRGARFVEIAIMSPVPPHGHRVPMFLGGEHAQTFVDLFTAYGMNLEIVSEQIGAASATKMCRSILVKGLEALLLECVLGAVPYGADERVFATLNETLPGVNWKELASYMVGRVVEHGERRARELEEVAATLRAIGVEPIITEAIVKRQEWCAKLDLLSDFGGHAPDDYRIVVQAITNKSRK